MANIGVVLATVGVLALGLFLVYKVIASAYHSSDSSLLILSFLGFRGQMKKEN